MAAGAPLIPEGALGVAALADLLIALLDILALGVLLGLLWTYKHTLGAVIQFLVDHTRIHTPFGSFSLLFPLDIANNNILAGMSTAALGLEIAAGRMFHALGVIFGWMVNLALYSATTMEHAFHWLVHVYIPGRASWAASVLYPPALIAKIVRSLIAKELPHIGRQAKAVAHDATTVVYRPVKVFGRRLTKAEKRIAALAAAIAALGGTVIHPGHTLTLPKAWRGLTKRIARLEKRMHRAEGWLAAGTLAAVIGQVLGVSARCLRSGNLGRTSRAICGLDSNLLGSLLADLASILSVVSIVEFATELRDIEDEAVAVMGALVREWPD